MKLRIALIRCGRTESGEQGRYLGLGDESLTVGTKDELLECRRTGGFPEAALVYTGPAPRCRETAALVYPAVPAVLLKDLAPFDYGELEGRTKAELEKDERFQEWARTETTSPCPGGEDPYRYQVRSVRAFRQVVEEMASKGLEQTALIAHGGAISAIMQRFCVTRSLYRDWLAEWGGGYLVEYDTLCAELLMRRTIGAGRQN